MKLVKNIILLITMFALGIPANAQDKSKQDILTSLGKSSTWNNVNYILFTSVSSNDHFKERSFLIDKSSGKVRFEGKTNANIKVVLLFNFKTKVLDKSFVNGKVADSKSIVSIQEVMTQLFEDSKLLFLPMLVLSSPKQNITITPGRIVNAEKLIEINFKNIFNLDKHSFSGAIYLNTKGDIKEYELNQVTFIVNDIKDIGDGILLPTHFINKHNPHSSIKFNTVAAFTDIEEYKFTNL